MSTSEIEDNQEHEAEKPPSDREIEAKFLLHPAAQIDQWREGAEFVPGFVLGAGVLVEDVDVYFDTADYGLLRRGFTLRLRNREREGSTEQIAGYKDIDFHTPRGVHSRVEVEERLDEPLPVDASFRLDALPERLADPLAETFAKRHKMSKSYAQILIPVVQVQQQRYKMPVSRTRKGRGGKQLKVQAPLGELSIDDLRFSADWPAGAAGASKQHEVAALRMAEVEIYAGDQRDTLRSLAGRMRELAGVEATELGKMQSALLALAQARTPADPNDAARMHTAEFCRAVWSRQLVTMLINEAGVRKSSDIEYVHEMRVATRRARAAMRLYAGFFGKENRAVRRFARALRTTGRLLGKVRDLDVAAERLQRFAEEKERTRGKRDKAGRLDAEMERLAAARQRAHADLVEWLDGDRYARFIMRFAAFCATPGKGVHEARPVAGEPPPPVQLRHTLPSMIWSRFEAVRAFEPLFEEAAQQQGALPVETLHALRIECKYLRYHLEFAEPLLGDEGGMLIDALKVLQEELGTLNDAVVGGTIIGAADGGKAARNAEPPSAAGDAMQLWQAQQQETIAHMRAEIPEGFAAFVGEQNRRHLAAALVRM